MTQKLDTCVRCGESISYGCGCTEIERLTAERDQLRDQYNHDRGTVKAAVDAAEAAEKKLAEARESLEDIACAGEHSPPDNLLGYWRGYEDGKVPAARMARKALATLAQINAEPDDFGGE